jgi:hypothetical protein
MKGLVAGNLYIELLNYIKTSEIKEPKTFAMFITWGGTKNRSQMALGEIKEVCRKKDKSRWNTTSSVTAVLLRAHT